VPIFCSTCSRVQTPSQLASELFDVYVLCDHYELSFRRPRQGTHETRVYTRASIIAISCRKDLLLLRVVRSKLMDLDGLCVNNHRALLLYLSLFSLLLQAFLVVMSFASRSQHVRAVCCHGHGPIPRFLVTSLGLVWKMKSAVEPWSSDAADLVAQRHTLDGRPGHIWC
jgi:hypothetical protein